MFKIVVAYRASFFTHENRAQLIEWSSFPTHSWAVESRIHSQNQQKRSKNAVEIHSFTLYIGSDFSLLLQTSE